MKDSPNRPEPLSECCPFCGTVLVKKTLKGGIIDSECPGCEVFTCLDFTKCHRPVDAGEEGG